MLELHAGHGLRDALRFIGLEGEGLRGGHRAKAAGTRATFAGDHKSRGASTPAFPSIGALRTLTHCVQAQVGNKRPGRKENRIGRQPHLDPGRLLCLMQSRIDFRAGH